MLANAAVAFLISLALPWLPVLGKTYSPVNAVGFAIDMSQQASAAGMTLSDFTRGLPDITRGAGFSRTVIAGGFVLAWILAIILSVAAVPLGLLGKWPTWAGATQGMAVLLATVGVMYGFGRMTRESTWGPLPGWSEVLSALPMGIWLSLIAGIASLAVVFLVRDGRSGFALAVTGTTAPE